MRKYYKGRASKARAKSVSRRKKSSRRGRIRKYGSSRGGIRL